VRRPKPDRPEDAGSADAEADERTIRTAALALLAGRDFSRQELTGRLLRKGFAARVVDAAVTTLVQQGLLRETRFVEQYVDQHARRGHGPHRIRMELRQRGVEDALIEQALAEAGLDWLQAAREARRRKFGASPPLDARERAKQARFLQYRGFTSDQIRAALGPDADVPELDADP
jgi:regulatory protein